MLISMKEKNTFDLTDFYGIGDRYATTIDWKAIFDKYIIWDSKTYKYTKARYSGDNE